MKKLLIILFMFLLVATMFLNIIVADHTISFAERRTLKDFPILNYKTITNGLFMEELEGYFLDHFVFRDELRHLKASIETGLFMKKDVNDYFVFEDHLSKIEYPYNPAMVDHFVEYITAIQETYFENQPVYFSIIPDKNYYMEDILKIDYSDMNRRLKTLNGTYINLFDVLTLDDYYTTDPHWRQEKLGAVLQLMSDSMGFELKNDFDDYSKVAFQEFYGAYYGQSAQDFDSDTLYYMTSDFLRDANLINYEHIDRDDSIYFEDKLTGMDPYEVFLGGASPLMVIDNPRANTEKELIVFRDSFASSISPLLVSSYKTITLVDTRYMSYKYLDEYVEIDNQDVLFLYSTLVVNNSIMLK